MNRVYAFFALLGFVGVLSAFKGGALPGPGGSGGTGLDNTKLAKSGDAFTGTEVCGTPDAGVANCLSSTTGRNLTLVPATGQTVAVTGSATIAGDLAVTSATTANTPLTATALAGSSTTDNFLRLNVSDDTGSGFMFWNLRGTDAQTIPAIYGYTAATNAANSGMYISALITAASDSSTAAVMRFNAARGTAITTNSAAVVTRPTFDWNNNGTLQMDLTAGGKLRPTGLALGSTYNTSCTLNAGTPATCTAALNAVCFPICAYGANGASGAPVSPVYCTLSGTTVTATGGNAANNVVNILCIPQS